MTPPAERKLSKDEVNALVQHVDEDGVQGGGSEDRRVEKYDFFAPSRFTRSDLEKLRRINASLANRADENVRGLLRSAAKTKLVGVEQMKWGSLVDEAGGATVGYTFAMPPMGYNGIITVDRKFAAACLERMLGGSGDEVEGDAMFTELEARIFRPFVENVISSLPDLWSEIGDFEVDIDHYVDDVQNLSLLPTGEDMFQLSFLMQCDFSSGQFGIAVPFDAVRGLSPGGEGRSKNVARSPEAVRAALRDSLQRTPVTVAAVLGSVEVGVRRLLSLEPGDVILLGTTIEYTLDLRINDTVKARGYPGTSKGKFAVKLKG